MLGVLSARRKPFQDSPTPAGNSAAAIALLRLHSYTNDPGYREKAEQTMEVFAGMAGQYGLFAATYGIASVHFSQPHTQVIVVGEGEQADRLEKAANSVFALNQASLRITRNQVVPQNLPPALAETLPNFAAQAQSPALALLCTSFSCRPPISDPAQLTSWDAVRRSWRGFSRGFRQANFWRSRAKKRADASIKLVPAADLKISKLLCYPWLLS